MPQTKTTILKNKLVEVIKKDQRFWDCFGQYSAQHFMMEHSSSADEVVDGCEYTDEVLQDVKNGLNALKNIYRGDFTKARKTLDDMNTTRNEDIRDVLLEIDGRFKAFL